jgi:hypothetical protein
MRLYDTRIPFKPLIAESGWPEMGPQSFRDNRELYRDLTGELKEEAIALFVLRRKYGLCPCVIETSRKIDHELEDFKMQRTVGNWIGEAKDWTLS